MHTYIRALGRIASRYAPSRVLSFDAVHVFKALQLIEIKGHVSRALLCKELLLGEGVIKTLIKHLRMQGLIESTKSGTRMTQKGKTISLQLFSVIPAGTSIQQSSVALGKFNYAVLLKQFGFAIKSGIEQMTLQLKWCRVVLPLYYLKMIYLERNIVNIGRNRRLFNLLIK
jgi:hypothetical protein